MSNLYRTVIARARAKALAARLGASFEGAATTYTASAQGAGRVRIGDQIYDATTTQSSGAVAVKNAGRPGAAVYAPTTASGASVTRSSSGSSGSTAVPVYHNQLLGLATGDDHPQYLNTYRGDQRYVAADRMIIAWPPLATTPTDGRLDDDVQIAINIATDSGLLGDATGLRLGTPTNASASTTNAVSGSGHTHAVTASSAPGAAASLLKSGADGRLTLVGIAATSEATTPKIVTASGDLWIAPASGKAGIGTATPAEALDVAGKIRAQTAVQTPQIESASGNLAIAPAGTLAIFASGKGARSYSYASGFTGNGWQIDDAITASGRASAEFDDLVIRGRMRVYELLIHQIRATNGSIFVSSTGKAKTVTNNGGGSYTITTETDHGFLQYDLIRAQRFTGTGIYQSDLTVASVASTTQFTATLRSGYTAPAVGMEFVRLGNTTDTTRQGSIYMTADDSGAPYIDIVNQIASFTDWNTAGKIKARIGRLDGITGRTQEYGLIAGNGFTATDPHVTISSQAAEIHNIPIRAYSGSTQTAEISSAGRLRVGTNISNANTTLIDANPAAGTLAIGNATNAANVTVYGVINVSAGGNAATLDNVTGAQNLVANSSFELDSDGDGLANSFGVYNVGGAQPTTASRVAGGKSAWAQRISWTGTNTTTKGIYFSTGTRRANTDYVITFWARTSAAVALSINHNVQPASKINLLWPTAGTSWQFYAARLQWSSENSDDWYLSITYGAAIANGWIEFDNVMVSEGSEVVPYAPALSDLIAYGGAVQMPAAPSGAGLYATSSYLGYYNGSAWRSYIDNGGNFYFAGNSGARLEYNASAGKLRGLNSSSVEQWYASASDGKLYAGAGKTVLDTSGLGLYYEAGWATAPDQSKIGWFTTPSDRTGEAFSLIVGDDQGVYAPEVPAASRGHGLYLVSANTILPTIFVKSTNAGPHAVVTVETRPPSISGNRWGVWPEVDSAGAMEIGKYIDFHETDGDTSSYSARITSASGALYTSGALDVSGIINAVGAISATGSTAVLRTYIRDDTSKYFAWYATAAALRASHSVNGDLLRITDSGRLMVGNTSDLYTAKIQTNGGIAASSWIHTDAYLQVKGGTEPSSHVDYFQIYMTQDVPAEGKRTVWVKCRNTTNTGDYSAVICRNYTP